MAKNLSRPRYAGTAPPPPGRPPYLPDEPLVEAVNLALFLGRPLLLKGEPGCGKTRLARAVADELRWHYVEWRVKSTSRARDGLYAYDSLARLRDAQLAAAGAGATADDPERYVRLGKLGEVFDHDEGPSVLLIDEIDKADIDFPNDLLHELEDLWFEVEETGRRVEAKHKPLVVVTSNDEKDLPDAFLRRCLVHVIEFPTPERLAEIVNAHLAPPKSAGPLLRKAVERFSKLRKRMEAEKGEAGKKVSTSELIDWCRVLKDFGDKDEALKALDGRLPYPSVLLKSWEDHRRYLREAELE